MASDAAVEFFKIEFKKNTIERYGTWTGRQEGVNQLPGGITLLVHLVSLIAPQRHDFCGFFGLNGRLRPRLRREGGAEISQPL